MTDAEVAEHIENLKSRIDPEMRWSHIDCESGWYRLIVDCDKELLSLDPHYVPVQIKQKFGGLRYYYNTSADEETALKMREVVDKYEALSVQTCEISGQPGKLMNCRGFYQTLSPLHTPTYAQEVKHHVK